MLKAFEKLFAMPEYGGKYCSFTPGHPNFVDEAEYQALVDAHIAFKDMSNDSYLLAAGIASDWPHGRLTFVKLFFLFSLVPPSFMKQRTTPRRAVALHQS